MKTRFLFSVPMYFAGIVFSMFFAGTALAVTYIVDNPSHPSFSGACVDGVRGDCSFQEAIALANANPGADTIIFHLSGADMAITAPVTVTEALTIDGYNRVDLSNPNSVPAPGLTDAIIPVAIDGRLLLAGSCLILDTINPDDAVLVKGIAVHSCPLHGIEIRGNNKTVQGSYIGTNLAGTSAQPNGGAGIYADKGHDVKIGGGTPADRNVISGNIGSGIVFTDAVNGSDIEGNFIGLDATGTSALGNGDFGIIMGSNKSPATISGNNIGNGPSDVGDGKRNYIGGNTSAGIYVAGAWTTKAFGWVNIENNYVGTDVFGTTAIPNGKGGIDVVISDDVRIEGNLVSGNTGNGVSVTGDDTLIPGGVGSYRISVFSNKIGTDASGLNPLGNTGTGVLFHNGTNRSFIGDASSAGSGNIIAYNTLAGVTILEENPPFTTDDNKIQTNSIFGNGGIGIDLASDGVTLNDANDPDIGANNLQNYPIVDSVSYAGGNTTINATLNSKLSRGPYRFEFFANDAADPSGYGEGQTYLGGVDGIFTDGFGNAGVVFAVAGDYTSKYITSTVTDTSQYTSEFGPMRDVDLTLAKTASAAAAEENDIVTFTVTVSNTAGPGNATGVEVTDLIGGGFVYVSDTASQGTYNSLTGVWSVGALAFGGSATLSIDAWVDKCGSLVNNASITAAGQYDPVAADNTASSTVTVACSPIAGGRPPTGGGSAGSDGSAGTGDATQSDDSADDESTLEDEEKPSDPANREDDTAEESSGQSDSGTGSSQPETGLTPPSSENTQPENSSKFCLDYDFNPANPEAVTRYEFIRLMLELNCHEVPPSIPGGEKSYADYPRDGDYDEQMTQILATVYYASEQNILSGYPDGTIRPFDSVNYAEASKILFSAAGMTREHYLDALGRVTFNFFGTEWYLRYFVFMLDLAGTTQIDPAETLNMENALSLANFLVEKY